jgi:hypothetical protein
LEILPLIENITASDMIKFLLKKLVHKSTLPARAPGRLALLGWRASLRCRRVKQFPV